MRLATLDSNRIPTLSEVTQLWRLKQFSSGVHLDDSQHAEVIVCTASVTSCERVASEYGVTGYEIAMYIRSWGQQCPDDLLVDLKKRHDRLLVERKIERAEAEKLRQRQEEEEEVEEERKRRRREAARKRAETKRQRELEATRQSKLEANKLAKQRGIEARRAKQRKLLRKQFKAAMKIIEELYAKHNLELKYPIVLRGTIEDIRKDYILSLINGNKFFEALKWVAYSIQAVLKTGSSGMGGFVSTDMELDEDVSWEDHKGFKRVYDQWEVFECLRLVLSRMGEPDLVARLFVIWCGDGPTPKALVMQGGQDLIKSTNREAVSKMIECLKRSEPLHPFVQKAERRLKQLDSTERHPSFDALDGCEFEILLEKAFSKRISDVSRTGGSGDYGADLILEGPDKTRVVVQAKRWKQKVNLKAVQEVIGAMSYYGADLGIVITTSGFFSSAKNLAQSSDIELWGEEEVTRLLAGDVSFSQLGSWRTR